MKILHIIYDDVRNPWLGGGGAVRALEINRRLAADGATITVVSGSFPMVGGEECHDGIRVIRPGDGTSYLRSRLSFTRTAPMVVHTVEHDIVVHDASPFNPINVRAVSNRPTLGIVHQVMGSMLLRKYPVVGVLPYLWERAHIRRFDDIVTETQPVADRIRDTLNATARIDVIPNGVDRALLAAEPVDGKTILFLGRMEIYQKGIDVLLQAVSAVARRHPGIEVVIAGSGHDAGRIEAMITDGGLSGCVRMVGRVDGDDKINLLRTCSFCVMPSRYEGWPVVAVEAAACAKPVIGTRIGGIEDAVIEDETGLLVDPGSVRSLAGAIQRLIEDDPLRKRLGQAARERASAYTWDRLAQQQRAVYERLLR